MNNNTNTQRKTIIIGAGLGGLIHGILLKMAEPKEEVVIYDLNKIPGGFCTAFKKAAQYNGEKIKYTINIPLITSDFGAGEPFDLFLNYLGVKNLQWRNITNLVQYYPENTAPFLFTKTGPEDLIERAKDKKERKNIKKYFDKMKRFYNDIFHKAYVNPTPLQSIKLLFTIPQTILTMLNDKPYLKVLDKIGIKSEDIKEILCAAEAFMGADVDKVSAVGEMLMIQSFLENNSYQPDASKGYTFQTLSDNLADRFKELGGNLILGQKVDHILFDKQNATGVVVNGKEESADTVIISTAQDVIAPLLQNGKHIKNIAKFLKKVNKLDYANSDYYCYYLIDKQTVIDNPKLIDIAYHVYKLPEGSDRCNWKLAMWVPNELVNDKYFVLSLVMVEQDQNVIDQWKDLRENDYKKYETEKEKIAQMYLEMLQEVEPIFKEHPPIKHLITFSPISYWQYGSRCPISGYAQTPANFGVNRMTPYLLDNLYISAGASFSGGVWGAIAGAWQGFVASYEKIYGIKIGDHDVLYKPGLKNLP